MVHHYLSLSDYTVVVVLLASLGQQQKERKTNYSVVFTDVLLQLSGVVTTTQQCLTKDVYEKNSRYTLLATSCELQMSLHSLKKVINDHEHQMYTSVALLVKWADFGNRNEQLQLDIFKIEGCIDTFRDTLHVSQRQLLMELVLME